MRRPRPATGTARANRRRRGISFSISCRGPPKIGAIMLAPERCWLLWWPARVATPFLIPTWIWWFAAVRISLCKCVQDFICDKARQGRITVWGRENAPRREFSHHPGAKIDPQYWAEFQINFLDFMKDKTGLSSRFAGQPTERRPDRAFSFPPRYLT